MRRPGLHRRAAQRHFRGDRRVGRGHRGVGRLCPLHRGRGDRRAHRGAPRDHQGQPAGQARRPAHGHPRGPVSGRRARERRGPELPGHARGVLPQADRRAHPASGGSGREAAMSLQQAREMEGVLLVDKPKGLTSHDVVYRLRRKLQMKKIGHAGTLDPMATGVLVMLIGKATRISQYPMSVDEIYEGEATLRVVTDSQDAESEVMETRPVPELTEAQVREVMKTFIGDQYQTPPMHSAIKIGGVKLYQLARKGEEVEREPRFIRVAAFDLLSFALPKLAFDLHCTKGTYC